jgi:hypothetical protein
MAKTKDLMAGRPRRNEALLKGVTSGYALKKVTML